jgi:hypothetical protein
VHWARFPFSFGSGGYASASSAKVAEGNSVFISTEDWAGTRELVLSDVESLGMISSGTHMRALKLHATGEWTSSCFIALFYVVDFNDLSALASGLVPGGLQRDSHPAVRS